MYIVTGGAGFVGSNLVRGLNEHGISDVLVVDNLERSKKFRNLSDCQIADYMDKEQFRNAVGSDKFGGDIQAVLHQGACTDTMEYNGRYMLDNNFTYSKDLLHWILARKIPFIYASSAAIYGRCRKFTEQPANENPLNIYGYSKLLFDQHVRRLLPEVESPVVGLRYFNVYGPNESHKERMASIVYQLYWQLKEQTTIKLFEGTDGYEDGEQRRDFVFVKDVVKVNLFFLEETLQKGIFNVGTGHSRSFNDVARTLTSLHAKGEIVYISFPETLKGKYQSYTEADVSALRAASYNEPFTTLEKGIAEYYTWLDESIGGLSRQQ